MKKERIEKAVEVINHAIQNNMSVKEASVKMGYADTYVKNIKALVYDEYDAGTLEDELFALFDTAYQEYRGKGNKTDEPIPEPKSSTGEQTIFTQQGDTASAEWKSGSNYPADHIKTLDQLLDATKVDRALWKVKDFVVNKWDVTAVIDKIPSTFQNFQVKARLEKDTQTSHERSIGELFREMTKNYVPPVFIPRKDSYLPLKTGENNLFEVTLFDLHIGKLAWGGETGENYDTKIARSRFLATIEKLIDRASGFAFNRILFPIGNDFFNSDTILNTTTKGTPQDEDLRWQKTFEVGVKLLVDAINLLKQLQVPVDVLVIPGNHDFERSFYMGSYLQAWFNNDPNVNINNGASPRKYYRFGNTLLGFTHGSEEKESSLPMLMSIDIESKPMWSDTLFHEWHLGHIHRKRDMKYTIQDKSRMVNEDLGVTIRYLSSLTGTEEWHHKKGFVGATKAGEAFIWNDELGLIAHLNANLIIEKYEE